jgi:hypothetical protein
MNTDRREFFHRLTAATAALGLSRTSRAADGEVRVDADFPGGNVSVAKIDGTTVRVAPDLRDTQKGQWWFYWCFRLRAPAGKPVRVVFTERNPIGVRGPAVSDDGGKTWKWLGAKAVRSEKRDGKTEWSFEAVVPQGKDELRYAFCPNYLQSHLEAFRKELKDNPALRVEELCRSRKDRPVELIRAGCLDEKKSRGAVILTSRHHACEAMATYAMDGFLRAVLADDELGRRWRANWQVLAVPFMDKDGVEGGDQGKNRAPHDHNRDYNAKPLYPEVAALMKLGSGIADRVAAAMDLHCPHIRGEWNDRVYLVGAPEKAAWERQLEFAKALEKVQTGGIKFRSRDCLEYGTAWNTKANFTQGQSNSGWARETFTNARLVTTVEIAYADALGKEVNADSARALGRDMAAAVAEVLAEKR